MDLKIALVRFAMPTLVCVPLMVSDIDLAIADAARAKVAGADVVEFRVDPLAHQLAPTAEEFAALVGRLVEGSMLPAIVTCRIEGEGGQYGGDDATRAGWLRELMRFAGMSGHANAAPMYIDLEGARLAASVDLTAFAASLGGSETRIVLSSHDFSGRPSDLTRRLLGLQDPRGSIAKIVYRARSLRDSLEILDIPNQMDRPTIALGMGEFGLMTRILAPKFGGLLTFASLGEGQSTAPGQPTIDELMNLYRFRSIGRDTKVYGVIGWPVSHSKSPATHNAWFEAAEHDGVYLPLPVAASEDADTTYASFKATLLELIDHPHLNFAGASVTIPFKEHLARLAEEQGWTITKPVSITKAANTLVVSGGGVSVMNTDWEGVLKPLHAEVGRLAGRRVLVLGAGGAARAAAAAMAFDGAHVIVSNRSPHRAEKLVAELTPREAVAGFGSLGVVAWSARGDTDAEVVVNATPMGMATGDAPNESPMTEAMLAVKRPVVFDTVYVPRETPLLKLAKGAGCRVIEGTAMFAAQASAQFEAWVGRPPPRV